MTYATVDDVIRLFRKLTPDEIARAEAILPIASDALRVEARHVGKNLDILAEDEAYANTLKAVVVDIVSRMLMSDQHSEPVQQFSQSALGYAVAGTYLNPGGGLFIKKSELSRLGLRKSAYGTLELYND